MKSFAGESFVCNRDVFCRFCCHFNHPLRSKVHARNMSQCLGDDSQLLLCINSFKNASLNLCPGLLSASAVGHFLTNSVAGFCFDLIGMDDGAPSISFPLSGRRETNGPYTLERSDITGVYSSFPRQWVGLYDLASTKQIY